MSSVVDVASVTVRFSMAGMAVGFTIAGVVAVAVAVGFRLVRLAIDVKGTRWRILFRLWIMNEASVAWCLIIRWSMNVASVARSPPIELETTVARELGRASVTCSIVVVDAVGSLVCIGVAMFMVS